MSLLCEDVNVIFLCFHGDRFILSLSACKNCLVIDDNLNLLPISSHALSITAVPPKSMVRYKDYIVCKVKPALKTTCI